MQSLILLHVPSCKSRRVPSRLVVKIFQKDSDAEGKYGREIGRQFLQETDGRNTRAFSAETEKKV